MDSNLNPQFNLKQKVADLVTSVELKQCKSLVEEIRTFCKADITLHNGRAEIFEMEPSIPGILNEDDQQQFPLNTIEDCRLAAAFSIAATRLVDDAFSRKMILDLAKHSLTSSHIKKSLLTTVVAESLTRVYLMKAKVNHLAIGVSRFWNAFIYYGQHLLLGKLDGNQNLNNIDKAIRSGNLDQFICNHIDAKNASPFDKLMYLIVKGVQLSTREMIDLVNTGFEDMSKYKNFGNHDEKKTTVQVSCLAWTIIGWNFTLQGVIREAMVAFIQAAIRDPTNRFLGYIRLVCYTMLGDVSVVSTIISEGLNKSDDDMNLKVFSESIKLRLECISKKDKLAIYQSSESLDYLCNSIIDNNYKLPVLTIRHVQETLHGYTSEDRDKEVACNIRFQVYRPCFHYIEKMFLTSLILAYDITPKEDRTFKRIHEMMNIYKDNYETSNASTLVIAKMMMKYKLIPAPEIQKHLLSSLDNGQESMWVHEQVKLILKLEGFQV